MKVGQGKFSACKKEKKFKTPNIDLVIVGILYLIYFVALLPIMQYVGRYCF